MNTAPTPAPPIAIEAYSHLAYYRRQAQATRNRRQAAGRYPTKAQKDAMRRMSMRDGYMNMTPADMLLLSTHPHLLESQRAEHKARYEAATAAVAA